MVKRLLQQLDLDEIIRGCQEEQRRPREEETGYCFELFRRAIEECSTEAWTAIEQQYNYLVLKWVQAQTSDLTSQEAEDMAQDAMVKFWHSLTQRSVRITSHFKHVGAILNYLHQCVVTTVIDRARREARQQKIIEKLKSTQEKTFSRSSNEAALEKLEQEERLHQISVWLKTSVTDPQEQLVIELSFGQDLSPQEIARRYPGEFPDAKAVSRIKERVLTRAKRSLRNSGKTG